MNRNIFIGEEVWIHELQWSDNSCTVGHTAIHGSFNPASYNWIRDRIRGGFVVTPSFKLSSAWMGGNDDESYFQYTCHYSEAKGYKPSGNPEAVPPMFGFYFSFHEHTNKPLLVRLRIEGMSDRIKGDRQDLDRLKITTHQSRWRPNGRSI
jgi:hypothetical protein|tara:strand:- start:2786 stop:3238 length:453 start_codon:yes stop_codon:yes gene_type:complete